ncbi:unnamed protein product [Brassica rapa]|uniref:Uncharacterized protein n=2 Tax=Brassica campestris TaxID=3711 RepID=A0A8D9DHQ5_BRACM|nr:unnamed protein product [Brassica rapa]
MQVHIIPRDPFRPISQKIQSRKDPFRKTRKFTGLENIVPIPYRDSSLRIRNLEYKNGRKVIGSSKQILGSKRKRHPLSDVVYIVLEPFGYPACWRTVGNMVRLLVSDIYDEHQKAKTRKRRPFYTPPPRLARTASSVNGLSSTSSTGAEAVPNHDPLVDAHRRLIGEVFFLRSQVEDMMACRDLLVQQVRASARWELMKEWLEKRVEHWDPEEEYLRHLFLSLGIDQQSGTFSPVATPRSVVRS